MDALKANGVFYMKIYMYHKQGRRVRFDSHSARGGALRAQLGRFVTFVHTGS